MKNKQWIVLEAAFSRRGIRATAEFLLEAVTVDKAVKILRNSLEPHGYSNIKIIGVWARDWTKEYNRITVVE